MQYCLKTENTLLNYHTKLGVSLPWINGSTIKKETKPYFDYLTVLVFKTMSVFLDNGNIQSMKASDGLDKELLIMWLSCVWSSPGRCKHMHWAPRAYTNSVIGLISQVSIMPTLEMRCWPINVHSTHPYTTLLIHVQHFQYVGGATNVKNCQMMCEHHVNKCETFSFENKAKYHKTFICGNNKIKEKKSR